MADNFCDTSSFLYFKEAGEENKTKAQGIIDRVAKEMEKDDEFFFCDARPEDRGVWFSSDEGFSPENVEAVARQLIEEIECQEPFVCSWSYTCSKPRVDEFGGGAFAMKRGVDTVWCDAVQHVTNLINK